MKKNRLFIISFLVVVSTAVFLIPTKSALQEGSGEYFETLIAGRNVNMVSGTSLPDGDPYLQRQNEPSLAVSSRNPLHLLAGANDYRTVDMPIVGEELPGIEGSMAADAWLGYYTSYDGGESWKSYLLPGFPQDLGSTSPLKSYSTAADPWVCAGSKGRFYYSGLVFNRGGKESAVFVARFEDTNDKEGGNTIEYRGVKIVATGNAGQFVDMPRMAVDVPRGASNDYIFLVYTVFVGNLEQNIKSKMYCTRSTDGGLTWSSPTKLSESQHIIQGASIAVDPLNGDVYVAFRRFYHRSQDSGIVIVKSTDRGSTFSFPQVIATFANDTFDQPATPDENKYPDPNDYVPGESFRTNSYPAIAVDDNNRVFVAWSQRNYGPSGEARIVMKTSVGGSSWSGPIEIDPPGSAHQGHQFMPQMAFAAGKLTLVWYDQRSDWSAQEYGFEHWLSDWWENTYGDFIRHTIDVWTAQVDADYYSDPTKWSYAQVSRYLYALLLDDYRNIVYYGGFPVIFPVQFNCPNYPLFKGGILPFMGDYIAIAAAPTIILKNGNWVFNTEYSDNPVFHVAWTDNRDVRPPAGIFGWTDYTPANSSQSSEFISPGRTSCTSGGNRPAIRNQNVYTSKLGWGIVAGSPTNEKSLDLSVPRAFVIFVQNNTEIFRRFRLTVTVQPLNGDASFLQFDSLDEIYAIIAPFSTISRQVFIQSTNPSDSARVDIVEIDANGNDISGGLAGYVIINGDPSNAGVSVDEEYHQPQFSNPNIVNWVVNPNIVNPNIVNPNIVNPNIVNPNIVNPNIVNDPLNPNIVNPNIVNPNIVNPNIVNPNIVNPNIVNPNIVNPNIVNPNIVNAGEPGDVNEVPVYDVMWTVTNEGNTTTSYTLATVAKKTPPEGVYAQLLVYRVHKTPAVAGAELSSTYTNYDECTLYEEPHHELILNILNPNIVNPNIVNLGTVNPNIVNPNIVNESIYNATFSLEPGEEAIVDLRVLDTEGTTESGGLVTTLNKFSTQAFDVNDFISSIGFVVTSMAVDSDDAAAGIKIPKGTATDLYIASGNPPDGVVGQSYEAYLTAFGGTAPYNYIWSLNSGELPPGLSISTGTTSDPMVEGAYGIISGIPTTAGTYVFMVQVTDDSDHIDTQLYSVTIFEESIPDEPSITTTSLPGGVQGTWYGATIHVAGGNPPFTFSWSGDTPEADGLMLDPTNGIISGTPTVQATYNFTVRVTDYDGDFDEQDYTLVILASPANYWKISGHVYDENTGEPLEGVLLHGLPNTPTTDVDGYYEDSIPEGWEGTVIPCKVGHTFDPVQRSYTSYDTVADIPNQDYNLVIPIVEISGTVNTGPGSELEGVIMVGLPGEPVTDLDGYYEAFVPQGWSGTVTPTLAGYDFDPPYRTYTDLTSDQTGQDYTGILIPITTIPAAEREALIALYNATNGDNWTNNSGWKSPPLHTDGFAMPGTEDTWYGITVEDGHVTKIGFPSNQLDGSIPPELANLTNLQSLILCHNQLTGEIPLELANLTNLQYLALHSNQLSGSIPPQLGNLTNLQRLYLNSNQLTGEIPVELGNLTNLQWLYLYSNQLTGEIPAELGNLTNLRTLYLSVNQLSGTIPPELGSLTSLQDLRLHSNQLTGEIPAELGNLINLEWLWLSSNQLTGEILAELGNLTSLRTLYLSGNQLSEAIPAALGNLTNLQRLYLNSNQLTGEIPAELGNLTALQDLYLSFNQLSGTIPPELGNLTNLTALALAQNQLSGAIPAQLGNLTNLTALALAQNQLSGAIPAQVGNLTNLQGLWLNSNQLTGEIPAELGNLTSLRTLYLSGNQLSGAIPAVLGNLTSLTGLSLAQNQLSGAIPSQLGNLTNLQYLYLIGNQLSGSIPASLTNLVNLSSLNTDYNALYALDAALIAFLDDKNPNWWATQTVAPTDVTATGTGPDTVLVSWTPIPYTAQGGGYRVFLSDASGGPYDLYGQTADKTVSSLSVSGLVPGQPYYFVVQTRTDPHGNNQNTVDSEYSAEAVAEALAHVLISGTVTLGDSGLAGVVMSGLPGEPVTDANGYYSASVSTGWSGTVTPTLAGYIFTPTSIFYPPVNSDQPNQNYTARFGTEAIDQSQTSVDYGFWFERTVIRWQEFKPTINNLSAVEIYLHRVGDPGNVVVEIRDLYDNVLYSATIPQSAVPVGRTWVRVSFLPISLSVGTKYRIFVYGDADSPDTENRYFWMGSHDSLYNSDCLTSVSSAWPTYDFAFKTFGYQ